MSKQGYATYIRNGRFTPDQVLPFSTPFDKKFRKGYLGADGKVHPVKMGSDRYWCFAVHGLTCVECGIEGKFFALESHKYQSEIRRFHFNLYGIDEDGNEVLMTKDHIQPKSKGGKNHITNYQPMCYKCNHRKGHKF